MLEPLRSNCVSCSYLSRGNAVKDNCIKTMIELMPRPAEHYINKLASMRLTAEKLLV